MASTLGASATSTSYANASRASRAVVSAAAPSTSATQTLAPSAEKTSAASRPMPPPAPVITATLPSSLPATLRLGRDEHVLDLGVALEGVHAELPPEPRSLEAPERSRHSHGAIGVDGEDARVDPPRNPE